MFNYQCDEVKKIIDEVSPNYPQLTVYEKEWLYFNKYGYIPGIPVNLEYITVETSNNATVHNTIPYIYKSAILKGQTIVNLSTNFIYKIGWSQEWEGESENNKRCGFSVKSAKGNTKYLIKNFNESTQAYIRYYSTYNATPLSESGWVNLPAIITTPTNTRKFTVSLRISEKNEEYTSPEQANKNIVVEYQDDAINVDIPFFESMLSVENPALTTSNEDGTNSNILTTNDLTLRSNGDTYDELNLINGQLTQRIDENNKLLDSPIVISTSYKLAKHYDGTTHYEVSSDTINPILYLEIPVVSTGAMTLQDIQNQD